MSPARTRRWNGSVLVGGEGTTTLDDFVLGTTVATALNTGSRIPDVNLSNYAGDLTNVTNGEVVSGLLITGRIAPTLGAGQSAIIRDSVALGQTDPTPTGGDYYNIGSATGHLGTVRYEHVEIRPSIGTYRPNGWKGGNVELYRCKASGLCDFISPHGSGSVWKSFKVHGCYADGFVSAVDPNQGDNITHNDWCQAQGGLTVLEIIGCTSGQTGRPRTSVILLQSGVSVVGGGRYEKVVITDNVFYGDTTEGTTINVPTSATNFDEFTLARNKVSSTGKTPRALLSSTVRTTFASTIFDNTVLETGDPLTINNA